jgi:heat shock protein HslJ
MGHFGNINGWLLATIVLLAGVLAACGGEEATVTSAPAVQPGPTETASGEPPAAQQKTIFVGPVLVDCVGFAAQKCLLVKENPDDTYAPFFDQIEGFEYQEGYEYELVVKTESVENPPADASSIKWTLVEVVNKTMSLEGRLWKLESYANSDGEVVSVLPGTETTIEFRAGQLGGNTGCNSYFGSYEVDGNSLNIGGTGMTEMYCGAPEGVMEQEGAYLAALQSAASYQIMNDQLQISNADGETVLAYTVLEPTPLTGNYWQLLGYNNGRGGFSSVLAGTEITAIFSDDGKLAGSAGCNNYTAGYKVDGDHMSIGPVAATRMMCAEPEGIMDQESAYLAALETAATYQIQNGRMEMRTADGALAATFEATDAAAAPDDLMMALKNMTYKIDTTVSGEARLTDGEYREKVAPDSSTETSVLLTEHVAYGTLRNGEPAAAVILVSDPGGSGTFYYMAIVTLQDGEPVNVATTLLGDRVQISSLAIEDGQIVVDMVTQGPDDPFCCPTQQVLQTYELQGEELMQTSSEVIGSTESSGEPGADIIGIVWKWQQLTTPVDVTTIDDPDKYRVEFQPDGQVAVLADCNNGSGTYTLDGGSIAIEIMAVTAAKCPPGSLSDEFIRNLNAAAIYFIKGGDLFIDLKFDSGTLKLTKGE